jgi:hypothetical protein
MRAEDDARKPFFPRNKESIFAGLTLLTGILFAGYTCGPAILAGNLTASAAYSFAMYAILGTAIGAVGWGLLLAIPSYIYDRGEQRKAKEANRSRGQNQQNQGQNNSDPGAAERIYNEVEPDRAVNSPASTATMGPKATIK